eukprot:12775254-Alexandrium_andersonii.AAC.1
MDSVGTATVVAVQETRLSREALPGAALLAKRHGWSAAFAPARPGQRQVGLAILGREPAQVVSSGWKAFGGSQ